MCISSIRCLRLPDVLLHIVININCSVEIWRRCDKMSSDSRRTRRCSEREPAVSLRLKYECHRRLALVADLRVRYYHTKMRTLKFIFTANFLISMLVYGGYITVCLMRGVDIDGQLGIARHHGRGGPSWALVAFLEIQLLVIYLMQ